MSEYKIYMPKLGESVQEATITKWFVKAGDSVEEDTSLFEVATDKVDSEIPSPVDGIVKKILFEQDAVVPVGEVVLILEVEGEADEPTPNVDEIPSTDEKSGEKTAAEAENSVKKEIIEGEVKDINHLSNRFFSPLVKSIAEKEGLSVSELERVQGSGDGGRVQKADILNYLEQRKSPVQSKVSAVPVEAPGVKENIPPVTASVKTSPVQEKSVIQIGQDDTVQAMDRVRKLIAQHMVDSKNIAAHVTAMVEADVTNLVLWRTKMKGLFASQYGEKLTYMPMFIEATARALSEFPMVNSSIDGDQIILRGRRNIGIAVAKPDGNLVVPVLKNADEKNLLGLTREMNHLANNARDNKLSPDDYQGGTFTITNFGSFKNLFGTPIINQPQVAILATGSIEKKPAVVETSVGDVIAIRHKMFLSLSYDHRIVDGALGGAFLRRIADLLEQWDVNRVI